MTKGYILVAVTPGREMLAYEAFMKIEEITEVSPLLGDIDFLLAMETPTPEEFARIVIRKIRTIVGVQSTKTMIQDDFVKHFEKLID